MNFHCVKIRSFFWSVFSWIQSEYRKIRTRKNTVFGLFLRSVFCSKFKQPCLCFTSLEPLILFYVHNSAISYVYRNVLKYTVLLMVFVLVSLLMTLNKNFLTRWCDMSFFGSLLISYDYALFLTIRLFPYQGNRGHYLFLGGGSSLGWDSSRHLLVQSQQRKHQINVGNLFKVNNKKNRTTSFSLITLVFPLLILNK